MYASFLRISRALHLVVFEQPENRKRDAAVLQIPNNFVVAKKPLPFEPLNSLRIIIFFNNLLMTD
jgi:hypothetical protein